MCHPKGKGVQTLRKDDEEKNSRRFIWRRYIPANRWRICIFQTRKRHARKPQHRQYRRIERTSEKPFAAARPVGRQ